MAVGWAPADVESIGLRRERRLNRHAQPGRCACADRRGSVRGVHPLEPVRTVLAATRRGGLDFDTAWGEALELAPPAWRDALQATRGGWARVYARHGPHELADIVALRRAAREQEETQPRRAAVRLAA